MCSAMSLLLLAACVKDDLHNTTHPDHGKITLTTDWTERGAGIDIPAGYTVKVGEYSATVSGAANAIDNLFVPGTYRAHIYNTAEHITVSGTTAGVSGVAAPDGQAGTFVNNAPGWFFTCAMDAKIEKDTDHEFTVKMIQQVRQLTLVVEPTGGTPERIASITGVLSGVAGTLNIDAGEHGTPSNVALTFTKIANGADVGKWKATVRLLGIAGTQQKLTGTIKFTDGSPADLSLESDLTTGMAAFNTDKKTPLTLGGQVVEMPTGAGFNATITNWQVQEEKDITIE